MQAWLSGLARTARLSSLGPGIDKGPLGSFGGCLGKPAGLAVG